MDNNKQQHAPDNQQPTTNNQQAYKADVTRALRIKADREAVAEAAEKAKEEAVAKAAGATAAAVAGERAAAAAALSEGLRGHNAKTAEQLQSLLGDLSTFKVGVWVGGSSRQRWTE